MGTSKPISPFRLSSLLRSQKDPTLAFQLFLNPNHNNPNPRPFRYSLLSYDLIITKLGRAKMFPQMEQVLQLLQSETRFQVPEPLFCHVISFYARARLPARAIRTFLSIPSFRCTPTFKSFNSLLHALLTCRDFHSLTQFLSRVNEFGAPDACTYNILINACSLSCDAERAWKLFDEMRTRGVRPTGVTFGTLINLLCKKSQLQEAFKVKEEMERVFKLKPNGSVYVNLIKGVCGVGDFDCAFRMKDEMVRNNLRLDVVVYNTLISALLKAGKKEEGFRVLEEMKNGGCKPDSVTCNVLIGEFCRERNFEEAYRVLDGMEGVKPDVVGYNVVIGWLCKEGKWREANDLFQDMPRRRCVPDVVTYRTLFDGLCRWMHFVEAALVLEEMVFKGFVPLSGSLNEFVGALCREGNFELLLTVLSGLGRGGFCNEDIWKTVVSLVCKSDKLLGPFELFDALVLA
ncbi:putative pentatricopeptide repeat-containing protein At1g53330 [Abrus precatorius]|uniref:Pentatricopeptide repeat-containing protein At1g53330 n=1 Tax=Abrus precatorius TaxID=3816 RepID=A0A8B8LID2_ABRPR|nr:putative pentatricopeptide repeat-containing protein At1g53330 [Abrus precatorius]